MDTVEELEQLIKILEDLIRALQLIENPFYIDPGEQRGRPH